MNDSLIRRFCESPRRRLAVTIATTLLGLIVLTPLVDEYFATRETCESLEEEVRLALKEVELLPQLEQQAEIVIAQLSGEEKRCVSEKNLSEYRSRLVEIVRDSGCKILRLELSPPQSRPWRTGDNALEQGETLSAQSHETPFFLEQRNILLSVSGDSANVYVLIEKLRKDITAAYPERMEIHSVGHTGEELELELQMWLFALSRGNS